MNLVNPIKSSTLKLGGAGGHLRSPTETSILNPGGAGVLPRPKTYIYSFERAPINVQGI